MKLIIDIGGNGVAAMLFDVLSTDKRVKQRLALLRRLEACIEKTAEQITGINGGMTINIKSVEVVE